MVSWNEKELFLNSSIIAFFFFLGYKNTPIDNKWNIIAFLFSLREGSWCFDPSKGPIDQHEGKLVETISAVILILPI